MRKRALEFIRLLSGEQFVEKHAKRVDVARSCDVVAAHLLGTCILRREDVGTCSCDFLPCVGTVVGEKLCDAEVEQLGISV